MPLAPHTGPASRRRVLVVEDRADLRAVTVALLSQAGYAVTAAATAADALRRTTDDGAVDLALVDAGLPDMAGSDLVARLRLAAPDLRAVITSGRGAETLAGLKDDPRCRFLPKPFDRAALVACIEDLLRA